MNIENGLDMDLASFLRSEQILVTPYIPFYC